MSTARPWRLYLLWAFAGAATLGWSAYWMRVRAEVLARADAWIVAQRAQGAQASYARVAASGFPLRLTLTFEDPVYSAPGGIWRLESRRIALHANPTDFSLFIVEPRAPVTWTTAAAARTFTPKTSALSLRLRDGQLERVVFEGEGLSMARDGAPNAAAGKVVASMRADPRKPGDGQLALDIDDLRLASPAPGFSALGVKVQKLHARAVFENGAPLMRPSRDQLGAWAAAGGALRVEGLGAEWGPAHLTATGRFTLDGQRRVAGALNIAGFLSGPLKLENGIVSFADRPIGKVEPIR